MKKQTAARTAKASTPVKASASTSSRASASMPVKASASTSSRASASTSSRASASTPVKASASVSSRASVPASASATVSNSTPETELTSNVTEPVAMYAFVSKNMCIGNYDSLHALRDAMKLYENGVDTGLSTVTAALNVSTVPFNSKQDPIPQTRYMRIALPGGEPLDPDFPAVLDHYNDVLKIVSAALNNGHCILLTCESGRRQAAVLAAMVLIHMKEPVNAVIEKIEFAYMTPNEREEYKRIYRLREANKHKDNYKLDMRDNRIYSQLVEDKLCLSVQTKKMLRYYAK